MSKMFKPGDTEIYQNIFDGLSYYQTTGEVYHTSRSKAKFHRFYKDAVAGINLPKVLDVGCGVGTEIFMLPKTEKGEYIGIDVSKDGIEYAKHLAHKRGEANVKFQAVDANKKLPFPNSHFDVIYALELVEHLKKPAEFLQEAHRLLKSNGRLIISTPNGNSLPNLVSSLLPSVLSKNISRERETDFTRHGDSFRIDPSTWDHEAHVSLQGFNAWKNLFLENYFDLDQVEGSSIFGGSRFISNRPFLLGLAILVDSLVDILPFKPHLQMCLVVSLKKRA